VPFAVVKIVKYRLEWAGHIAKKRETRITCRIVVRIALGEDGLEDRRIC
jgi:hypothetical protein